MQGRVKIYIGLAVFLGLVTFPVWYGAARGNEPWSPPEVASDNKECVEPAGYMRDQHARLLAEWRDSAVRNGETTYMSTAGKEYEMNLNTCLSCHTNKEQFCDKCHTYAGAEVKCWDCHVAPESGK